MTITVKKIALSEPIEIRGEQRITDNCLEFIGGVEVECFVRLGTLTMTVAQLSQLKQGQVLSLHEKTNEPVDIILNNQVIARGELMSCDENFAIQITEICS